MHYCVILTCEEEGSIYASEAWADSLSSRSAELRIPSAKFFESIVLMRDNIVQLSQRLRCVDRGASSILVYSSDHTAITFVTVRYGRSRSSVR